MNVETGGRRILIQGMALVLVGLLWGFVVPTTPYPRLALVAHIQFEMNGLLFIVLGVLLLKLPHNVGPKSIAVMLLSVVLTWIMVLSEAANAWWGTNQMLPIAAGQAGASGGEPWQEFVLKLTHIGAGLGLVVAWALLIVGFVRHPNASRSTT
jgi:(hydroxyamino)benzene mutase